MTLSPITEAELLNDGGLRAIALTFDVDWAPDFAIRALLDRLEAAGVHATLFVTHPTPVLEDAGSDRIELGLHPHLPDRLDLEAALEKVRPLAPGASGVRFHRLIQSTPLMAALGAAGYQYDASMLVPYQSHLRPFAFPAPLVRIPYPWEDDVHAAVGRPWALEAMGLETPGLKICDFHPIHVCLNTDRLERYDRAKAAAFTEAACRSLCHDGTGAGTLLEALLEHIARNGVRTYCLRELAAAVREGRVTDGCAMSR